MTALNAYEVAYRAHFTSVEPTEVRIDHQDHDFDLCPAWPQRPHTEARLCEACRTIHLDHEPELRAEIERLQRENDSLARSYALCEQTLRERTEEINRLRAVAGAAFAYVHTPTDDPDTGALYRALQVAVTEMVVSASHAAASQALARPANHYA